MRTFLIGLAVGVVIVLLAPLVARQMAAVPASASPSASIPPSPSGSVAAGVTAQLSAVDRALTQAQQTGRAVPVSLTFTERDLTASAATYFPQTMSGVTLTDPLVRLRAGQISLDMTATAAFLRGIATVTATAEVVNGRPSTTVVSATVGGARLPQSVTSDIKSQLDRALAAGLPAKFAVTAITVGEGTLAVTGVANP